MVDHEPAILLGCSRLEWAKQLAKQDQAGAAAPDAMAQYLQEARDIALRSGYRLDLSDIHLLCAQVLRRKENGEEKLLELTAPEHLEKAKEYALDVSEFFHLYKSEDTDFYNGIPEYDMLKRGPSEEERIKWQKS
jgi:hypothetical protein